MPRLLFRNTRCATCKKTKQTERRNCEPLSKGKTTLRCPGCWTGHTGAVKQLLGPEMPSLQPSRCHRSPKKTGPLGTGEDGPAECRKAALHVAKEMRSRKEKNKQGPLFPGEGSRLSAESCGLSLLTGGGSHQEEGKNGRGQGQ